MNAVYFPKAKTDRESEADIVIIGGGLAGLLTAYVLASDETNEMLGKKIIVLEAGRLGMGVTQYTTAFITTSLDTDTSDLIDMFGVKKTRTILESHSAAIDMIEKIVKKEKIDCDFTRTTQYIYAREEKDFTDLEDEYAALKKLGQNVHIEKSAEKSAEKNGSTHLGFEQYGFLSIPNQAKFDANAFVKGLVHALKNMRVEIHEKTEVTEVVERKNIPLMVKFGKNGLNTIMTHWVITATYQPFDNPMPVFLKKGMYKTYVMELKIPQARFTDGLYEDTYNPYHYFRVDAGRMIIGGEDHRDEIKMDEKKNFQALEEYAEKIFGERYPVTKRWTGPILEPVDGIALIGLTSPYRLVATAFSGNGMTYSAMSAMIFRDIILKHSTAGGSSDTGVSTADVRAWTKIYDPHRTPTIKQLWKKGKDYGEELIQGALKNSFK